MDHLRGLEQRGTIRQDLVRWTVNHRRPHSPINSNISGNGREISLDVISASHSEEPYDPSRCAESNS